MGRLSTWKIVPGCRHGKLFIGRPCKKRVDDLLNHLTPNGHFSGRTAPLTYRCCILYIYSTNTRTEYFEHAAYSPFFPLQNVVYFIMLPFCSCIIHILYKVSQEERSIFWEVIVSVILSKKLYMNMCPIPNGFRDRAI